MKKLLSVLAAICLIEGIVPSHAMGITWSSLDGKIKDTLESLKLGRHSIESDYESGTLKVTGYVATEDEKHRVIESLARLEGIEKVEDKLEVKGSKGGFASGDEAVRKTALEAIKALTGLGSYEVDLEGDNGSLVLTGTVSSVKDKTRIEDAARLAVGNHPFKSRLELAPPLPDSQIEKNVWNALNKEKDLDTSGITIAVQEGVVTISGEKPNHRLIDRILSIANMADGIREIKSKLRIAQ